MMPSLTDSHCHLDFKDSPEELTELIERAHAQGVQRMVSIGTDLESSERAVRLAEHFEGVYAVVGWHPCDALAAPADITESLVRLAGHPKVVALGETGLDFCRMERDAEGSLLAKHDEEIARQKDLFAQHLEVAKRTGLHLVIHQRGAMEETLGYMETRDPSIRAVFHCFVDGPDALHRVLDLGCLVSFTGILTFKNAREVRESLKAVPAGSFMLETDSPYLAPEPFRGKKCEPALLKWTAERAAQERGVTLEELVQQADACASRIFRNWA